jgi:DNA-binding CsgD family transcriptional regulator/catechol 2,3-dioxygenase-like lactoylglutathione lyase family enzyme
MSSAVSKRGRPPYDDQLTPAEWRVADAVRHGGTNRTIGRRLGISPDGVKFHVASIVGKLGLNDRRALRHWPGIPRASALSQSTTTGEGPMTDTTPHWGSIGQIARSVADINAAEAWYRDVLRLPHLYTFGNLAFFDCGGTRLMLTAGESPTPDTYVIYFRVPDIHSAHAEMSARGVAFEGAPHIIHTHADGTEEWMAFFKDNEGRLLGLMCQVPPRA